MVIKKTDHYGRVWSEALEEEGWLGSKKVTELASGHYLYVKHHPFRAAVAVTVPLALTALYFTYAPYSALVNKGIAGVVGWHSQGAAFLGSKIPVIAGMTSQVLVGTLMAVSAVAAVSLIAMGAYKVGSYMENVVQEKFLGPKISTLA